MSKSGHILYRFESCFPAESLAEKLRQALKLAGAQLVPDDSGLFASLAVWVGSRETANFGGDAAQLWKVVVEPAEPEPRLHLLPPDKPRVLVALADWLAARSTDVDNFDVDLTHGLDDSRWRNILCGLLQSLGAEKIWRFPAGMPWAALFRRRDVDGVDTTEAWVVFLVDSQDGSQGLKEVLGPGQGTARDRLMDRLGLRGEAIGSADAICLIAVDRYGSDDMPNWMAVALRSCELRLRRWIARDLERLIFEYPALMRRHFAPTTERLRDLLAQEKARAAEMEATNQALRRTEQERVWEQRQRMRAERDAVWKELAARIAHKLGNPVAVVSLIEANLRDHIRPDDEEGIDILNDLSNTVKRMKTYIAEFTSHVKATSTLMEAMPLSNVIANLSTSPMMRHGDVQLSEFTSGVTVKVDLQKLLEVFEELFSNARSIAKDEGMVPQIRVHWALKDKPPRESGLHEGRAYLRISIEDNGPGVKDKHKESIFLPYVTTRAEGSGQGLAIVRRIVEDHEGAIIEDGLSGSGACFHIFLPAYGDEK